MTDEAAVLHITAASGGGTDRYIRDLTAATTRRHHILHAGPHIAVLEDVSAGRFAPVHALAGTPGAIAALSGWIAKAGIGIAHLHGVDAGCRAHLDALQRAQELPYLVTLHDLQFVNPRAFETSGMPDPDPEWISSLTPTLERAATVIAPSSFILDIALACSPVLQACVIAPGIRPAAGGSMPEAAADFAAARPAHIVAVVGAVGPHKGSGVLESIAAALEGSGIGIVVIGYTDTHLTPGWVVPGTLYVHGAYDDGALAGWLAAYRVETVLFPNRFPESFSYTLSEVWQAGVPVIVPDQGALGERVARDGGGWTLPEGFDGQDAAALLVWLASPEGAAERARVKSRIVAGDAQRIPSLETMAQDVDALYERFGLRPAAPADPVAAGAALVPLLAANLDGFAFRKELVNLSRELAQTRQWNEKLERDGAAWAAKLEGDIAALKEAIERLDAENRDLAKYKRFCDRLPGFVRRFVFERAPRARP
jgi:glycosyltransferase involved in cell wall biosynthesis